LTITEEETPLMNKLDVLAGVIGKWATVSAILALALYTIFWLCNIFFGAGQSLISETSL